MLIRRSIQFLGIALLLICSASIINAQRRINFARGAISASVSGTVSSRGARTFVVRCFGGQLLRAWVRSGNGRVDFANEREFSVMTDHAGDYFITILNHGSSTSYTLTVKIR